MLKTILRIFHVKTPPHSGGNFYPNNTRGGPIVSMPLCTYGVTVAQVLTKVRSIMAVDLLQVPQE